jgi:hypothetical protein
MKQKNQYSFFKLQYHCLLDLVMIFPGCDKNQRECSVQLIVISPAETTYCYVDKILQPSTSLV